MKRMSIEEAVNVYENHKLEYYVIHCKNCKKCVCEGDMYTCGIDLKGVKPDHFCGYAIEKETK